MVFYKVISFLSIFSFGAILPVFGQTELDGIMMQKKYFCVGGTVSTASWKNYWEGKTLRNNLNLGTVKTNAFLLMGNYGIKDNWNIIFGLPYIATKASAGQLAGQKGLQDFSLFNKYAFKAKHIFNGQLTPIVLGGLSIPVGNYTPDLLPLSIGLKSKTAQLRAMVDFEKKDFTGTISLAYVYRGNVTLDRNSYYTTEMHYTNQVWMPNMSNVNMRFGYRGDQIIAEAILDQSNSLGGFDITKNNMPFVSNQMNATRVGGHFKWEIKKISGLSINLDGMATVAGRNIGSSNAFASGVFYIIDFKREKDASK